MPAGNDPWQIGDVPDPVAQMIRDRIDALIPARFRAPVDLPAEVDTALADGGAPSLYFTGPVGSGKTHAAWSAVRRILERDPELAFHLQMKNAVVAHRSTTLLDLLRPSDDPSAARQEVTRCQRAILLYLDDLGAEKPTEWTQERLYEIVDHRYAHMLPVIVTSNLPPAKLGAHVSERVASRLAEMCTVVPLVTSDRRRPR